MNKHLCQTIFRPRFWCRRPPGHSGPCALSPWWQDRRLRRTLIRDRRAFTAAQQREPDPDMGYSPTYKDFKDMEKDIGR